jgi:multiple antibiotic resistance protein
MGPAASMDLTSFQHYLIGLLAIGNNVSAIGAFLSQTKGLPQAKVRRSILVTSGACLGMLVLFMLMGTAILDFFGISISAFQIAGGLLLGGVGLDMMNARQPDAFDMKAGDRQAVDGQAGDSGRALQRSGDDAQLYASAVVPIAIPLTVGAGTFSAVILFADLAQRSGTSIHLFAAIVGLVLVNHLVFNFSARIVRSAGEVGLSVFTKIMGLFTLAIGVEFIVRGLSTIYRQLHAG